LLNLPWASLSAAAERHIVNMFLISLLTYHALTFWHTDCFSIYIMKTLSIIAISFALGYIVNIPPHVPEWAKINLTEWDCAADPAKQETICIRFKEGRLEAYQIFPKKE
jgi:hypothetical protein